MKDKFVVKVFCPDCKKQFFRLDLLNRHIGQTKCNRGQKVTITKILTEIGIIGNSFEISMQNVIKAI